MPLVIACAVSVVLAVLGARTCATALTGLNRADDKLDAVVHIPVGPLTVKRLAKLLSEQTGAVIEAADYLEDRTLLLASPDIKARALLDLVTALEGWRWFEVEPGRYRLARHPMRPPKDIGGVPAAMQSALPLDVRAFLGLPDSPPPDRYQIMGEMAEFKLAGVAGSTTRNLLDSITLDGPDPKPVPFAKLNEQQRQQLTLAHLLRELRMTVNLLFDDFGVHRIDPAQSIIELQNGYVLMVEMVIDKSKDRNVGFGTAVTKPPDP